MTALPGFGSWARVPSQRYPGGTMSSRPEKVLSSSSSAAATGSMGEAIAAAAGGGGGAWTSSRQFRSLLEHLWRWRHRCEVPPWLLALRCAKQLGHTATMALPFSSFFFIKKSHTLEPGRLPRPRVAGDDACPAAAPDLLLLVLVVAM